MPHQLTSTLKHSTYTSPSLLGFQHSSLLKVTCCKFSFNLIIQQLCWCVCRRQAAVVQDDQGSSMCAEWYSKWSLNLRQLATEWENDLIWKLISLLQEVPLRRFFLCSYFCILFTLHTPVHAFNLIYFTLSILRPFCNKHALYPQFPTLSYHPFISQFLLFCLPSITLFFFSFAELCYI